MPFFPSSSVLHKPTEKECLIRKTNTNRSIAVSFPIFQEKAGRLLRSG